MTNIANYQRSETAVIHFESQMQRSPDTSNIILKTSIASNLLGTIKLPSNKEKA